MATEYSISVSDWDYESWEFVDRDIEYEKHGEWSEDNEQGISSDDYVPMMHYAYPLYDCPSDKQIFKIHEKTCLTVVRNIEGEEYYLVLCGGGMDCSQSIGMAYIIAEDHILYALAQQISRQPNLTQYGKNFRLEMKYVITSWKKAKVKTIAVSWGYNTKTALLNESPDYVIDSPLELEKIVLF